ncbi:MAG: potassium channel family protein [Pikeienuella sp.]|uniref:potassium channel family protein n=1 Tax=Pikeienuella sp. TaxID=2831957 RepID=UPI00391DE8FD
MYERKRSFIVIGLGAFGSTVASELARFENYVTGVDLDERRVSVMGSSLSQALIMDATDEAALRDAGADQHDVAVVAIGRNIEASILTVMNLRMLGLKTIWAKAASRTHHRILSKLDVDRVILPEQEMGQHAAQVLHNPAVRDYVSLGNGFHVVTIGVPQRLEGKTVPGLRLAEKFDLRGLGVMRGAKFHDCAEEDFALAKEDRLLVLGRRPDLRRFGDAI